MQQEQLDRVVPGAESGAFRTDGTFKVRNTESEKRVEAERVDRFQGAGDKSYHLQLIHIIHSYIE